jgi:hypothetical protein
MEHEVHSKKNQSTKDAFPPKITTACDHSIPCPKRSENYVHCDPPTTNYSKYTFTKENHMYMA